MHTILPAACWGACFGARKTAAIVAAPVGHMPLVSGTGLTGTVSLMRSFCRFSARLAIADDKSCRQVRSERYRAPALLPNGYRAYASGEMPEGIVSSRPVCRFRNQPFSPHACMLAATCQDGLRKAKWWA